MSTEKVTKKRNMRKRRKAKRRLMRIQFLQVRKVGVDGVFFSWSLGRAGINVESG